jgi:hypothetical protein
MVTVLFLFVVTTCKWSINLFTNPNPVYGHTHTTWQYVIVCGLLDLESSKFVLSSSNLSAKFKFPLTNALKYLLHNPKTERAWVAVTFWTGILQVLGSNSGRDTGYPDWGFTWSSSARMGICPAGHDRFPPNPFQFIILPSPQHSMLW